jgi:serine phosphatase RsbU (regulator of sigma subunit)/anti-sigma regulatory factor (Ser/Thr protein kinase)/anti-anti-sigma regulatory factor
MTAEKGSDEAMGAADDVRRIFENAPIMMLALQGPEHRYVTANRAFREFAPTADAVGKPVREVFPELEGHGFYEIVDRVYRTGEPCSTTAGRVHAGGDGTDPGQSVAFTVAPHRRADGSIEGVLVVGDGLDIAAHHRLTAEDRAQEVSEGYRHSRDSGKVMQQELLAASVPVLPGADIAAEYLVAAVDTAAGGDWFDAIARGEELLLVVGDVVGHGVKAAAVMSQLQTAVRMQILEGRDIGEALEAVERFRQHVPGSKSATLCIGRLNLGSGEFQYCTAGHPPPLVVSADATPRFLEPSGAGPLGSGTGFPVRTESLDLGDAVLLYTDGLIERPGRPLAASTAEFAHLAATILNGGGLDVGSAIRPVDRLCSQTLELMLRSTGYSDDVTLLAAQRRTPTEPLHFAVGATLDAAREVRARLRNWLSDLGAGAPDTTDVVYAISELIENAVEHAYPGETAGEVVVEAALGNDGMLTASVTDHGRWKDAHDGDKSGGGRGLAVAEAMVFETQVTRSDAGTTAALTHRLSRPARIVTDPSAAPAAGKTLDYEFRTAVNDAGHVVVIGDVDSRAATELAQQIAFESRAGTTSVTVDLSSVTHLGSAGVSALLETAERSRRNKTTCTFIAPPGSRAHQVLSLVQLPVVGRVGGSGSG